MKYAMTLDQLIDRMRRATPHGRARFLAGHKRLMRRGVHLPAVPSGMRVVAGQLVPLRRGRRCEEVT